jgi:hypothetical protein
MIWISPWNWFTMYCILFLSDNAESFGIHNNLNIYRICMKYALYAKKSSKAKSSTVKKSTSVIAGVKGFGGTNPSVVALNGLSSNKKDGLIKLDRSKNALAFYDFLESHGAGDNLKRVALGYFPLPDGVNQLRGVVALRDIPKGEVILRIPYELAINLGVEGDDPTLPAWMFLQQYCQTLTPSTTVSKTSVIDHSPYFRMLPEYQGSDCQGATDFFPDAALDALQAPTMVVETKSRKNRAQQYLDSIMEEKFPWVDGTTTLDLSHLSWAIWLITSRVLTVVGPPSMDENDGLPSASSSSSFRLLIPFLDMCNHDRSSPHILTGRAMPGGELKILAGSTVLAGSQINIMYGGGVAGNDRFLQDYGFLDSNEKAYDVVAQQILGRTTATARRLSSSMIGKATMSKADRDATLSALETTTLSDDEQLLAFHKKEPAMMTAIQYRIGVKRALSRLTSI